MKLISSGHALLLIILAICMLASTSAINAASPLEIAQLAYLKASNTRPGQAFGWSVAVSGETVVVGAPREREEVAGNGSTALGGGAFIFVRDETNWVLQAHLRAYDDTSENNPRVGFGESVAVAGDTVVIGAPNEFIGNDDEDENYGAAYIFVRNGTNWSQQARLSASNTEGGDQFGISVAVAGDTVVIGAPHESSNAIGVNGDQSNNATPSSGAAYVFVRDGTNWTQQAYLKSSNTGEGDNFGVSVAASDELVVVGAPYEDSNATGVNGNQGDDVFNSGAAYVFVRNGTSWSQQAYLKPPNVGNYLFGTSIAASGSTVVVGGPNEGHDGTGVNSSVFNFEASMSGAAYVFVREGATWVQQAYFKASNTGLDDNFGRAVAVSGDTVVIGAPYEDSSATGVNPQTGQTDDSAPEAGAVYVFRRSGTNWIQRAYVKASNTGPSAVPHGDFFGYAVGISGDIFVSGAPEERSNATGVNGDQTNNDATGAGAAYLFGDSIPNSPIEGLSVAREPLLYPISPQKVLVDAAATVLLTNTVNWMNGTLEVDLQPFTAGEEQLTLQSGMFGSNRLEIVGGVVSFGAVEIATLASNASGGMIVTFNGNATTAGVEAVVRNVAYTNSNFAGHIRSNDSARFADRTVTFQLRDLNSDRGQASRVVRFPYLVSLETPSSIFIVRNDPTYILKVFGIFSEGTRLDLAPPGVDVGICSDILRYRADSSFGFRAKHVGVGGGVCQVIFSIGSIATVTTVYVKDECFLVAIITRKTDGLPDDGLALSAAGELPAIPLGIFYGLEALMNQTPAGQRLTALYWRHTQELVDLIRTNSALRAQTIEVLVDFQPALLALLLGDGTGSLISPAMIDHLNLVWSSIANVASPALYADMEAEHARFNGFQAFVGKNFSEWAGLLEVPVPAQPYVQIFYAAKLPGQFILEANALPRVDYSLWKSSNLFSGTWEPVAGAIVEVHPGGVHLVDTNASPSLLFYKVGARPLP